MTTSGNARYKIGQLIHHKLFDYRGVIVDVDPVFQGPEELYSLAVPHNPPRNQPWYHILVHGTLHRTYSAEIYLEPDPLDEPIDHPELDYFFEKFENGMYVSRHTTN